MQLILLLKALGIILPTVTAIIAFTARTKTADGKLTRTGHFQISLMLITSVIGGAVLMIESEQGRIAREGQISRMNELATGLSKNLEVSKKTLDQTVNVLQASHDVADFIAGGSSWPEIVPIIGYGPDGAKITFGVNVRGKKAAGRVAPLRTLNISLVRDTDILNGKGDVGGFMFFHRVFESYFGGWDQSHVTDPQQLTGDQQTFDSDSFALNGRWHQTIKLKRIGSKWEWRSVTYIPGASQTVLTKVLQSRSTRGFPLEELNRPIQPVTAADIGPR